MVGGSTWGAVYDVARLTNGLAGAGRIEPHTTDRAEHLDRIVENNADSYAVIARPLLADGRYHRTMGNHDDVFSVEPQHRDALADHLPACEPSTRSCSSAPGTGRGRGRRNRGGHHPRPPDRRLERPRHRVPRAAVTWLANTLDDLPRIRPDRRVARRGGTRPAARRAGPQPPHHARPSLRRQPSLRLPRRGTPLRLACGARARPRMAVDRLRPHPLPDAVARSTRSGHAGHATPTRAAACSTARSVRSSGTRATAARCTADRGVDEPADRRAARTGARRSRARGPPDVDRHRQPGPTDRGSAAGVAEAAVAPLGVVELVDLDEL